MKPYTSDAERFFVTLFGTSWTAAWLRLTRLDCGFVGRRSSSSKWGERRSQNAKGKMPARIDLSDPISSLLLVARALSNAGIESATYGGLALAAYGEPRETKDADLAIAGTSSAESVEALRRAGLEVRLAPPNEPREALRGYDDDRSIDSADRGFQTGFLF